LKWKQLKKCNLFLKGLLDDEGNPQYLAGIITHLHYHEPGNLAFVYLLRSGALRMLCQPEKDGTISRETQLNVVLVLSYLFAPLLLQKRAQNVKYNNSKVVLPPLPPEIKTVIELSTFYNWVWWIIVSSDDTFTVQHFPLLLCWSVLLPHQYLLPDCHIIIRLCLGFVCTFSFIH
jgi:hypothetical protein